MKLHYKHIVALIYGVVLFLDRLDLTIVNVTLPTLAKVFHVPLTDTDWVNVSFLLALAVSIPISSWLGERFGFKHIYIFAMLLFGIGSTLCAFSPNLDFLVISRLIHGIGGGLLIPTGMTILYRIYDKSEYASITSFTFLPSLIAPAIAPFLGGILLDIWNWQVVFLFSGPICLVLALISIFYLNDKEIHLSKKLDWIGFILFSAILADVFYSLSLVGKEYNLLLIGLIIVPLLIYFFIKQENRAETPLFDLSYFTNSIFIKANVIQLCFQICHYGAIFLIGMYLQIGIGINASMAGLIMGMQALGAMAVSRYSVRLYQLYGPIWPIVIGLVGVAILSPCILIINTTNFVWLGVILFFSRGLFSGLCGVPIQTMGIVDFEKDKIASANAIFNACRQVSISLGIAISSGLMTIGMQVASITHIEQINSNVSITIFGPGFFMISFIAIMGILLTLRNTQGLYSHQK